MDKYGNEWREKILPNGEQVWVQIRGHNVWNAGKNITPRTYDPNTGFASPINPRKPKNKNKP